MTLAQLIEMADARGDLEWSQTAEILSLLYSYFRGENSPDLGPEDFNHFSRRRKATASEASYMPIEHLAIAWVDKQELRR